MKFLLLIVIVYVKDTDWKQGRRSKPYLLIRDWTELAGVFYNRILNEDKIFFVDVRTGLYSSDCLLGTDIKHLNIVRKFPFGTAGLLQQKARRWFLSYFARIKIFRIQHGTKN